MSPSKRYITRTVYRVVTERDGVSATTYLTAKNLVQASIYADEAWGVDVQSVAEWFSAVVPELGELRPPRG